MMGAGSAVRDLSLDGWLPACVSVPMRIMNNDVCRLTGAQFPLFAFSHCRDVVVAVSRAGGFGVLGGSSFTPEALEVELKWIDDHVEGKPYGIDILIPENQA